ncbi:MAG TPA: IS630 family transposase [Pararhizobium sp.]|jgi:transposase|nr:IS630 family transposase [Pararhizobium sp.]
MIRPGFLTAAERKELRALARDGLSEARAARRANAIVLLNDGWSCEAVAAALLIDDDTVRSWHELYAEHGITGLVVFHHRGSQSHLTSAQEAALFEWVRTSLPRNTRTIGAWIARTHGVDYSHAGLIALLHRLKLAYRKPDLVSPKLDAVKQKAFIKDYDRLLNGLGPDEAVVFADAVHPTHQARVAGCWAAEDEEIAIQPSSGRDRLNIHGAVDLETGKTQMLDVQTVDAHSTILLLMAILVAYPSLRMIHVFLDNARYHHARLVREWLAREGCRITLHFIPAYSPHLNPIERLWGAMHRNVTHNKCYATFRAFKATAMTFLTEDVPKQWHDLRDTVTDNFRVIDPANFRVLR